MRINEKSTQTHTSEGLALILTFSMPIKCMICAKWQVCLSFFEKALKKKNHQTENFAIDSDSLRSHSWRYWDRSSWNTFFSSISQYENLLRLSISVRGVLFVSFFEVTQKILVGFQNRTKQMNWHKIQICLWRLHKSRDLKSLLKKTNR